MIGDGPVLRLTALPEPEQLTQKAQPLDRHFSMVGHG